MVPVCEYYEKYGWHFTGEQSIRVVQQLSNNQYISGFIFDAKVLTFDKFVTPWKPFLSEVYPNRL